MKNMLILGIITLSVASMVFVACNDEQEDNKSQIIVTKAKEKMGKFYLGGCGNSNCPENKDKTTSMHCHYNEHGNCFPEVVVYGTRLNHINSLRSAIDNNTAIRFIQSNMKQLGECFDSNLLQEVINRNVNLSYNLTASYVYFQFMDNKTKEYIAVYPFSLKND